MFNIVDVLKQKGFYLYEYMSDFEKFKEELPTIMLIIFWDILMDEQISFSPQAKRSVIICNKDGIYRWPHKLLNNLRLRILGN